MPIDIQFVRLERDVCESLNRMARNEGRTVSELVNQIVREYLANGPDLAAGGAVAD